MDAYMSGARAGASGFDPPPVLIAADTEQGLERAARTIDACGLRTAGRVLMDAAPERLAQQIAASALWIELDADRGAPMDRLLDQVNRDAGDGRYSAVVAAPSALLDAIDARLTNGAVAVVVDGDEAERTAALTVALSGTHRPAMLSDVASDRSAARLRQLSDEVSRIASTLARLSTSPEAAARPTELPPGVGDVPDVTADTIRTVIRARRLRSRFFDEGMFADPAWDMLLDLLQAEIAQLRVPVSSLCIAASVPATTALRWLKTMTQQGLFLRRADPHDGRRVFVELAPAASLALRRYFAEAGKPMVV
jgi:DNA-binding MarR family transcriptional regulator